MNILDIELDLTIDILEKRKKWEEVFHNPNPVIVDMGSGKGHFLAEMARANPDKNFLGIEIYKKGLRKTKKKIQNMGLANVRLIPFEILFVLKNFFHPNEIQEVYINFPDPWPKRRHWKRRFVNPTFIDTLYPLLKEKGRVNIATDFEGYVPVILKSFEDHPGFKNIFKSGNTLFDSNEKSYVNKLDNRDQSLYEKKYLKEGKLIHYFIFEKRGLEEKSCD
ncbi:MAG TPA: tRNA (guanosine(46)-N7)-methyltransferase TrmB [Nitrospinota bacterium]|nr:tRNA (guanosine(46)-N7)-methyltransferase TrmB [Nitrospinota bacterium]